MTRRLVPICAIGVLVSLFAPATGQATSIPGPNGKIVFASGRANSDEPSPAAGNDNNARLWVADYPSGTPVQVTTGPKGIQDRHPNWSPDHTRIVYAAGEPFNTKGEYELRIVDLRTGIDSQFAPKAEKQDRPTWSPDGTRIAYGSRGDLWVKSVAPGSEPVQLTNTPEFWEERPVWSPDGQTLYYNREALPTPTPRNRDIYKLSPVTPSGTETPVIEGTTDDWQPALSPDGSRLCFLRGPQNDEADLYTYNLDGSSGPAELATTEKVGELNCVWSPDGTKIMYTQGAFGAGEIATRDPNGKNFALLSQFNVEQHFDGNVDWATNFSPECNSKSLDLGVNQFVTVGLSCIDPDAGFGAEPPTPTPLESEALEIASAPSHGTLGGISKDGKVIYTPNKDFKGTDSFSYTGTDGTSNATPATVTLRVGLKAGENDRTPPKISDIRVSPKRWRRGHGLATISLVPVGTKISFHLSEAARATLTFQRAKPGRRVAKACVKPASANIGKRACTRYVSAGSISLAAKAGRNRVRFEGLLSKSRRLPPGTYRVVVGARDAAGNQSKRNGPKFTIVKG